MKQVTKAAHDANLGKCILSVSCIHTCSIELQLDVFGFCSVNWICFFKHIVSSGYFPRT